MASVGATPPRGARHQDVEEIREVGIDFVRVVPGSRDMPPEVAGPSIMALAKVVGEFGS